ncbi:radical SAM protein [Desulfosarcina sp. OttesenSCG-928-A07]|nr:radical SAM protein [Desulfosarcina sp. OttesenSCG-928-G17]MDL2329006.1 radical SAM protein [Desulfosarcina sp. OttesenSCG-928-A07]
MIATARAAERGTIRKSASGRLRVALVYPNTYWVGMSNLGFQTVYRLINAFDHVVCERAFFPEAENRHEPIKTLENNRPLGEFDIIAFSISYENDAPRILTLLEKAGCSLFAAQRDDTCPLVLAGGVFCFLNPEPLSPFIDVFLLGEAEILIPDFFEAFDPSLKKQALLESLSQTVQGVYVPQLYQPRNNTDHTLAEFSPVGAAPPTVKRVMAPDLSTIPTASTILTPHTTFADTYLIEVSRGCAHGCRFCSAGYIYRPPRFRSLSLLSRQVDEGCALTDRIGLVGAAVSDLPEIGQLCGKNRGRDVHFAFSSLRADALDGPLIQALRKSRAKTATIAPDAGSERMRRVINKGLSETQILTAAEMLVDAGIPNLKLYFMVGLPTETEDDVMEVVTLVKRIKACFLAASRKTGRMGSITVSVSSFVPKPFTPFQWTAMDTVKTLKRKIKIIRDGLKSTPNVRVHADSPGNAYFQGIIARGDRRVAAVLLAVYQNQGVIPGKFDGWEMDPGFYVHRERFPDERFPWEFIDHGIDRRYLLKEYHRALEARVSPPCPADPSHCRLCGVCGTPMTT